MRGSFKHEDAMQGFGFQEGFLRITKSVIAVHQFPPNKETKEQSDAFTAMRWTGTRLDAEWNEIGEDQQPVVIPIRMGATKDMRPGQLDPKDFDNLEADPDDLGDDVDTEGNALFMVEGGAKVGGSWPDMEESLRKQGFKPEISGRGVASDFEGLVAHFKTIEGKPYVARSGKKAGQTVTPTILVCDRIHTFPYDKAAKKAGAKAGAAAGKTAAKPNGSAAASETGLTAAKDVFGKLSPEFKKAVAPGKEVETAVFQKELTRELMRQKLNPVVQKQVLDITKNPEQFADLAMALVDQPGAFILGDGTVQFE